MRVRAAVAHAVGQSDWHADLKVAHADLSKRRIASNKPVARTESRFDVPANHAEVRSPVLVAGIAWADRRRIAQVQVSANDGATWTDTVLG